MHLLGAMHCQGDLASFDARGCALHYKPLRGESLEPGGRSTSSLMTICTVLMSINAHLC